MDKVIVVDDGSIDMTAEIAKATGALVIEHEKNFGKGVALQTILNIIREEKPDVLVLLDADGQHDPNEIPTIIEPILRGEADIVIGSRFKGKSKIPLYRKIGLKILSKMARSLSDFGISDPLSGFRALSKIAYEKINLTERGYGTEVEMLIQARENNLRITEVPIRVEYKTGTKTSKRSPISQASEIANTIIRKTIERRPLLFLGMPGIISVTIGFYFILQLIDLFNHTRYFSTPLAIIALGFILTGLALITTALIIFVLVSMLQKYNL